MVMSIGTAESQLTNFNKGIFAVSTITMDSAQCSNFSAAASRFSCSTGELLGSHIFCTYIYTHQSMRSTRTVIIKTHTKITRSMSLLGSQMPVEYEPYVSTIALGHNFRTQEWTFSIDFSICTAISGTIALVYLA